MTAPAFAPAFEDRELVPVGDWMPARYTPSLTGTEHFATEGDRLLAFLAVHWRTAEAVEFLLDPWQRWLVRHILEVYPEDWPVAHLRRQLRFRQVVVSLARQNGKSVIGAVLAFYYLTMHVRGPRVISIASNEGQARIVYDRVKYAAETNPVMAREIKTTLKAGITLRHRPGVYFTMPNKEETAQGEPVSGCIYDELHIGKAALWDALVKGQTARANSQLCGITTAGDDDSDLLIRLYVDGAAAIAGEDERFGFFVWEAPDDSPPTAEAVIAANPAVACGRIPLDQALTDAVKLWRAPKDKTGVTGRDRCLRYTLNRFVEGSSQSWASLTAFKAGTLEPEAPRAHGRGIVFGLERTDAFEWFSITATSKREDGTFLTELVASLEAPSHETQLALCKVLARTHAGAAFALDRSRLAGLGRALSEEGLEVWQLIAGEMAEAMAGARAAIARRALAHPGDKLVALQMKQARKRDSGDSSRLSRSLSTGDIDAVVAMVAGLHVAAVRPDPTPQIF